ncbi:MAG: beta-propeller domain-containing protein [Bacillota bacterium]
MIFNLFEFVYNNALTISIIALSLLLALFLGRKWYVEVKMNRRLNIKKTMLRNLREVSFKLPSLKRSFAVFVPIIFLGLFFLLSFDVPTDYTNHVKRIEDEETFMDLYETFNEKFYSTPLQSADVLENASQVNRLNANSNGLVEGLDYVASHGDYVFVLNDSGIKVVNGNEESLTLEKTIGFPREDQCEDDLFDPLGIAVHGDKLISAGYLPPAQCSESTASLLGGSKTVIRIYDIGEDFDLSDEYRISGHLNQGHYEEGRLVFASNAYLPADPDKNMLESYFPHITHNGNRETADFSGLRYIENTNPNTFLSLTLIDVQEGSYDFETTLTDYKYLLEMNHEHVYVSADAYEFDTTSEVFEMQNPIKATHTILSKFSLRDDEILFSKTRQHKNMTTPFDSLKDTESGVFTLLKSDTDYHLVWFDKNMERIDETVWSLGETYTSLEHVGQSLFLYEGDVPTSEIKISNNQLINMNGVDYEKASLHSMYPLNASDMTLAISGNETSPNLSLLSSELAVVDEYELDNLSMSLEAFERFTLEQKDDQHIFYVPLGRTQDDSNYISEDKILVLSVRDEREILTHSMIEMNNIPNPMTPFVYRHLTINKEEYHVTPGGIFVTTHPSDEVIRKIRID